MKNPKKTQKKQQPNRKNQNAQPQTQPPPAYKCDFCGKVLTTEKRLLYHLCEKKRRFLQREERAVGVGFTAFQIFWKRRQNPKQTMTWDFFEKSSLYLAFVKFGRYVMMTHAIEPMNFVHFLINGQVGIDDWCRPTVYEAYVRELTKNESPLEALQRSFVLMEHWAMEAGEHWTNFFRKIAPSQAVMWIISGRISPLLLFTAASVDELFTRLSDEQKELIQGVIDDKFWTRKMDIHKNEISEIINELAAHDI